MSYTPRFSNLVEMLEQSVERFGARPLFGTRRAEGWVWMSYDAFFGEVLRCSALLVQLGVSKGDRVAIISNNRVEWPIAAFATHRLGATVVPMYQMQLDEDWALILGDSGAKVCFVASDAIAQRVDGMRSQLGDLKHLISFEHTDSSSSFAALMEGVESKVPERIVPAPEDRAYFFYTSGTTGKPKGVELTHFGCAANASAVVDLFPLQQDDRSLAFLPWAHVFGGTSELNVLIAVGGSLAICESTDKIIEFLAEVRPTMLVSVPRIWNRIYGGLQKQIEEKPGIIQAIFHNGMSGVAKRKAGKPLTFVEKISLPLLEKLILAKVKKRFGGRLKYAISGAAALSPDVAEFIDNLGIDVYEAYGLTESSCGVTANRPGDRRIGSVGKPLLGVEVKLDEQFGTKPGEGEVVIYGTGVMAGYHNRPDWTSEVMTADGGLRTGDLGCFDQDGFLYITGRIKELFKLSNGKYVAPAHIEETITLSPYVAQVMVNGADRPYVVALIVPDFERLEEWAKEQGLPLTRKELLAHPATQLLFQTEVAAKCAGGRGYEQVKEFILLPEEFTVENDMLTPTLKVKRRIVEARFREQIAALYPPEDTCP